jgi:hypothetical protein
MECNAWFCVSLWLAIRNHAISSSLSWTASCLTSSFSSFTGTAFLSAFFGGALAFFLGLSDAGSDLRLGFGFGFAGAGEDSLTCFAQLRSVSSNLVLTSFL